MTRLLMAGNGQSLTQAEAGACVEGLATSVCYPPCFSERKVKQQKATSMKCEKCGSSVTSQLFNRMGDKAAFWELHGEAGRLSRGILHADKEKRYVGWRCGHPLAPNAGCGHSWIEALGSSHGG